MSTLHQLVEAFRGERRDHRTSAAAGKPSRNRRVNSPSAIPRTTQTRRSSSTMIRLGASIASLIVDSHVFERLPCGSPRYLAQPVGEA